MDNIENSLVCAKKSNFTTLKYKIVGSRATCYPPPDNSDYDILVLVENLDEAVNSLDHFWKVEGYIKDPNDKPEHRFLSVRNKDINLILTESEVFYDRFSQASDVAKIMNLTNKKDRIKLFLFILYGNAT